MVHTDRLVGWLRSRFSSGPSSSTTQLAINARLWGTDGLAGLFGKSVRPLRDSNMNEHRIHRIFEVSAMMKGTHMRGRVPSRF
jgi:hypothetical protein